MTEGLKLFLNRIPYPIVGTLAFFYFGYDIYSFQYDSASELNQARAQVAQATQQRDELRQRVNEARAFVAELEQKRAELRALFEQLTEMRNVLTENIDLTSLTQLVVTEAKKAGLRVQSISPENESAKEFYFEQPLTVKFKGIFAQMVVFLSRLSDAKRIVRSEELVVEPGIEPRSGDRLVDLAGTIHLSAYRYNRSKADEIMDQALKQPSQPEQGGQ